MLPAYLEGAALRDLLPTIKAAAAALTPSFEILILDTAATMDDTEEVCTLNAVSATSAARVATSMAMPSALASRGAWHVPALYGRRWLSQRLVLRLDVGATGEISTSS